jgi:hypothetical protein
MGIPIYFIDSKELERIDRESEELEKICARVRNPRAWRR